MAPPRAYAWPASIYRDPAVLSVDPNGRFILCRACLDYHDRCGGKTPKPVVMNARYRTRAWDTHKRRTRAHRTYDKVHEHDCELPSLRIEDFHPAADVASSLEMTGAKDKRSTLNKQSACVHLTYEPMVSLRNQALAQDDLTREHISSMTARMATLPLNLHRPCDGTMSSTARHQDTISLREPDANRLPECRIVVDLAQVDAQKRSADGRWPLLTLCVMNHDQEPPRSRPSIGHHLRSILNPAAPDPPEHDDANGPERCFDLMLSAWASQKLRRNQGRPCCDGRSETHQLYWQTMRQVFSDPPP